MKLYLRYFSIHIRSAMEYKGSFILSLIGTFTTSFAGFLTVFFLFDRFHAVEGFTFGEVLLCFSAVNMGFSLAECFFRGFDLFPSMLANGEFDRILVRPRNPVFQVLASKMEFSRLGKLIQAAAILIYALFACGVEWTLLRAAALVLMIFGSLTVFAGLFFLFAGVCFFTTEGLEVFNIFTNGGNEFGQYPLSIYGKGVLRLMTFVVPLSLAQYYPLLFILGRSESILSFLAPLGTLLFWLPCLAVWKAGTRHYRSTGS